MTTVNYGPWSQSVQAYFKVLSSIVWKNWNILVEVWIISIRSFSVAINGLAHNYLVKINFSCFYQLFAHLVTPLNLKMVGSLFLWMYRNVFRFFNIFLKYLVLYFPIIYFEFHPYSDPEQNVNISSIKLRILTVLNVEFAESSLRSSAYTGNTKQITLDLSELSDFEHQFSLTTFKRLTITPASHILNVYQFYGRL